MAFYAMQYVVVIGNMGTGKSSFIKKFLPKAADKKPEVTSDSCYVTKAQETYLVEGGKITLVDTVGLDEPSHDGGLDRNFLENNEVAFVVLLNSSRWESQRQLFCQKLGWANNIPGNVSFYGAHNASFKVGENGAPPSINEVVRLSDFPFAKQKYVEEVKTQPVTSLPGHTGIKQAGKPGSKQKDRDAMSKMLFHKPVASLNLRQKRLYDLLSRGHFHKISFQKQMKANDWQAIKTQEAINARSQKGDSALRYFLIHIYSGEQTDKSAEKCNNGPLSEVLKRQAGLEQHVVHSVYKDQPLNAKSLGDYMEALFEYILEQKTQFVVDFLDHVMNCLEGELTLK